MTVFKLTKSPKVSLKNKLNTRGIQLFSVVQDKDMHPKIQILANTKVKKKKKLAQLT